MIITNPSHNDFNRMIESIQGVSDKVFESYSSTKYFLSCCKSQGVPIIGNPLYPLENQLLHLHYSILQHLINCQIYNKIFLPNLEDELFLEQIKGLTLMSMDFEYSSKNLIRKLASIQTSFLPKASLIA